MARLDPSSKEAEYLQREREASRIRSLERRRRIAEGDGTEQDFLSLETQRAYYREVKFPKETIRYKEDPQFKLRKLLRSRVRQALLGYKKSGSAVKLLGCTVPEAIAHIESLFQPGMTWENWKLDGWHLDHKVCLASFDLEDPDQLARACHISNLQPLWAADNLRKDADSTKRKPS